MPEGAALLGCARLHRGVLQLTPRGEYCGNEGTFTLDVPNIGSSTLTIAFDLLLGTGGGAEGISIVYGPVPTHAFGPTGTNLGPTYYGPHTPPDGSVQLPSGAGIEVWVRTGETDLLQIYYKGQPIGSRKMHGALRTDAFLNASLSISDTGAFELKLGNGVFHERLQLPDWSPKSDWKIGLGGSCVDACASPENAQWVDNLLVHADAFVQTATVDLCVAINGQQCTPPANYSYNALWRVSKAYPMHGPVRGGTAVTVHGSNFHGGASDEYSCRFGSKVHGWREVKGTLTTATTDGDWGRVSANLVCVSPEAFYQHDMTLELQVSLNKQEYPLNASYLVYHYYYHPTIDAIYPVSGPTAGGTLVRMYGSYLHGGSFTTALATNRTGAYRCRMGDAVVPASLDPASGALLCFSPPAPGGVPAEYPLDIALNIEHFDHDQPTFTYYEPPTIISVSPTRGYSNGTEVTITGTGVWRDGPFASTPAHPHQTLCRFGTALSNATKIGDGSSITCIAPESAQAGAWSRINQHFSEPHYDIAEYGYYLDLRGRAEVKHGKLILVQHDPMLQLAMIGTIVVQLPQPAVAPYHFKAQYKLKMGGGSGADGMSFSYGDLSSGPIGELGGGRGLRVCFRTHTHERVEIWYADTLRHVSSNKSVLTWPQGHSLRSNDFVDVLVQYSTDGLTVRHKGVTHAVGLIIEGWRPQHGWMFALGARAGQLSDDHHIDDLIIDGGAAIAPEAAPLSITHNGLQFTSAPVPFVYEVESQEESGIIHVDARSDRRPGDL